MIRQDNDVSCFQRLRSCGELSFATNRLDLSANKLIEDILFIRDSIDISTIDWFDENWTGSRLITLSWSIVQRKPRRNWIKPERVALLLFIFLFLDFLVCSATVTRLEETFQIDSFVRSSIYLNTIIFFNFHIETEIFNCRWVAIFQIKIFHIVLTFIQK